VEVSISAPIGGEKRNALSSEKVGDKEDPTGPETGFYLADLVKLRLQGLDRGGMLGRSWCLLLLLPAGKSCMSELSAPSGDAKG
jgi:hypothetical protein